MQDVKCVRQHQFAGNAAVSNLIAVPRRRAGFKARLSPVCHLCTLCLRVGGQPDIDVEQHQQGCCCLFLLPFTSPSPACVHPASAQTLACHLIADVVLQAASAAAQQAQVAAQASAVQAGQAQEAAQGAARALLASKRAEIEAADMLEKPKNPKDADPAAADILKVLHPGAISASPRTCFYMNPVFAWTPCLLLTLQEVMSMVCRNCSHM